MAAYLLVGPGRGGFSATSVAVAVVGIVVCVTLRLMPNLARVTTSSAELMAGGLVVAYLGLGSVFTEAAAGILGRGADLTGRAIDIWPKVLAVAARHPMLGTGYGGVWGLGDELSVSLQVEQAHNGYLDVYLQLGLLGVVLLGAFLLGIAGRVRREAPRDIDWACFTLSMLLTFMIYNLTESAFFDTYFGAVVILVGTVFARATDPPVVPRRGARSGGRAREDGLPGPAVVKGRWHPKLKPPAGIRGSGWQFGGPRLLSDDEISLPSYEQECNPSSEGCRCSWGELDDL